MIIGIDYGNKNIGLAVLEPISGASKPLTVIKSGDIDMQTELVLREIMPWKPSKIVIGLPEARTQESKNLVRNLQEFIKILRKKSADLEILTISEAHSTRESNLGLNPKLKRTMGDAFSAEYIVKSWFSANSVV